MTTLLPAPVSVPATTLRSRSIARLHAYGAVLAAWLRKQQTSRAVVLLIPLMGLVASSKSTAVCSTTSWSDDPSTLYWPVDLFKPRAIKEQRIFFNRDHRLHAS